MGAVSAEALGRTASLFLGLTGSTFRELVDARAALEVLCARMAARCQNSVGLARLCQTAESPLQVDLTDDRVFFDTTTAFHEALTGASGNRALDLLAGSILSMYLRRVPASFTPVDDRSALVDIHLAITEAIVAGDAETAARLTGDHAAGVADRLAGELTELFDTVLAWE